MIDEEFIDGTKDNYGRNILKKEFKQAKKDAVASCLGSRPLFDEIEFEIPEKRTTRFNIFASTHKSEFETTRERIKSKHAKELKAIRLIREISDKLDERCKNNEKIKMKIHEECHTESELKQVLLMRKQTLETLQLTHRAIRLESEGSSASAAQALEYILRLQNDDTTVQLTVEEYVELTRAAKEEMSLNDWRVSVFTEQRLLAQESRDLAFKTFERLYENDLKHGKDEIRADKSVGSQNKKDHLEIIDEEDAEMICLTRSPQHLVDVSESSDSMNLVPIRKKPSVFALIRKLIEQKCL